MVPGRLEVRKLTAKNDLDGAVVEADWSEHPRRLSDAMVHHRGQDKAAEQRETRGQQTAEN